ncbi:glycosyltransferase family 2 protein [Pseudoalteromonas arctica]|uniref:Glycosyltransferase family 2 protein n=1 Tax=Pseudoalteromonas arctica TaxID=394751 RepID=A0A7Y0DUU4_9GAMM|nr:glycosyltransferase family 2 protein [Pseudoalteromonas arctica]NMM42047.1 glycosyltransferase family 2 protein [Pseudoalteromonas arctica]
MKSIAVILPTFKPGNYLLKCFRCLEAQTINKAQYCLYIGLNGPKKGYEELILALLDNAEFNYKYFYLPTAGVSFARNTLIDESIENYLVFLDDDDEISPNYLESLLAVTTPKTMGLANVVNFTEDKNTYFENYIGKSFASLPKKGTSAYQYRKYFSSPWAKMLHRDMIANIRFDTRLALGEDGFFMANVSKNIESFEKCSNDTVYYVNVRQNSSSRKKIDKAKELKRIIYLTGCYLKMLLCCEYNRLFITTRVAATLLNLKKIFN